MAESKPKKERRAKPSTKPTPQQLTQGKGASQQQAGDNANLLAAVQQAIPGLPADLLTQVGQIISAGGDKDRIFSYLRGTDWFSHAYAGFNEGAQTGLFGGDLGGLAGYRGWRTQVQNTFKQYYGKDAGENDFRSYAAQGYDNSTIENIGQGHAWAQANMGDVQYLEGAFDSGQLTPDQLQTLGEQQSGRTSAMGALLETKFKNALARMQDMFQGTLATQAQQKLPVQQNPNKPPDVAA